MTKEQMEEIQREKLIALERKVRELGERVKDLETKEELNQRPIQVVDSLIETLIEKGRSDVQGIGVYLPHVERLVKIKTEMILQDETLAKIRGIIK